MTKLEMVQALTTRLTDNFTTLALFSDPNEAQATTPEAGYVGFHMPAGIERQVASTGGSDAAFRFWGSFDLEIYTPKGDGIGLALSVSDEISELFRSWYDTDIIVTEIQGDPVGMTGDDQYYQLNLCIYFELDSNHSLNPAYEAPLPVNRIFDRHTATDHGYSIGNLLDKDFQLAIAVGEANKAAYIVSRVCTANVFEWTALGVSNYPAHGLGAAGTPIYLSAATAGAATATAPTAGGSFQQQVGSVISTASVFFNPSTVVVAN